VEGSDGSIERLLGCRNRLSSGALAACLKPLLLLDAMSDGLLETAPVGEELLRGHGHAHNADGLQVREEGLVDTRLGEQPGRSAPGRSARGR
jgi:hypothetical protein